MIKEIKLSMVFDNGKEIPFVINSNWKINMSCDPETMRKTCVIEWGGEKEKGGDSLIKRQ